MINLFTNIQGKVNNTKLPISNSLLPLFETVVNAIQSIEDMGDISMGRIEIYAIRDSFQQINLKGELTGARFVSFKVIDNGLGFNSENYDSFLTSDSLYKKDKGCKGVGRFLWLKAFENVRIESTYNEAGKWFRRKFNFNWKSGIEPENNLEEIEESENKTIVELQNFNNNYSKSTTSNLKHIAEKLIEHILTYFISEKSPQISLIDNLGEIICLNDFFNEAVKGTLHKDPLIIKGRDFTLYHLQLSSSTSSHKLHLCANGRDVKSIELKKYVNNLQKKVKSLNNNEYWYVGYLVGEYLDDIVNTERTDFVFPTEYDSILFAEYITETSIINACISFIKLYLSEDLKHIDQLKHKIINDYIDKKKPQYRALAKYKKDFYDDIPAGLSNDKLELELHRQLINWENDLKAQEQKLLDKNLKIDNIETFREKYLDYCRQISALGKTSLAEYIVRRKAILDLLNTAISYSDQRDDYNLESSVHSIICPLRYTSDELDYEDMNLWIIDEKLSYHYYLASDKSLKSLPVIDSTSRKELDLVIFNNAFSFVAGNRPYTNITIIEFKKPMRNDYNENENPVSQVFQYIDDIRSGKAKDKYGRPITPSDILKNIPIYCYIISDLTEKMVKFSRNAQLRLTPDGEGYFGYDLERKAYIEVVSYNKLIDDATKRNQILFDKLFNPRLSEKILKEEIV